MLNSSSTTEKYETIASSNANVLGKSRNGLSIASVTVFSMTFLPYNFPTKNWYMGYARSIAFSFSYMMMTSVNLNCLVCPQC